MSNQILKYRNLHLAIASLAIGLVGLSYGLCPSMVLPLLFDFKVESIDLNHVFRAMMGLYLGFATYWVIGIFKLEHWRGATISSIFFMGGLALGRMVSIPIDGIPSVAFLIGTVIEILFMLWGVLNLKINYPFIAKSALTTHKMKKTLLLFLLTYANVCFGQTTKYSTAQVQEDIQYLHQQLKKHHPNLYVYASKAQLDSTVAALIKEADHPVNEQELYAHITRFSAIIKDGHTLFFPSANSLEFHNKQSLFFPFKVFYQSGKLYVELNCSLSEEIANGTEILSINGLPTEQVIQFCLERMMRDGHNLNYPIWILNQYFAEYYSYFYGHPPEFLLELKMSRGEKRSVTVAALPKAKIREIRAARFPNRLTARGLNQEPGTGILLKIDILRRIATLSIRDFDSGILKTVYQQDFKKTIGYLFAQIKEAQIKHLIIDLRGNQGGNLENGTFLLSQLLPEKFRVVEQFNVVKNPEAATEQERNVLKKGRGTQLNPPQAKPFLSPTYLLVDGGSFSNSGIVSSAFRHYQRGKIIGEETGGNKSVICGWVEAVTLPHSKISVSIPTRQFLIRDRFKNDGHGVIPDFMVQPTIQELAKGKDEVLDFTLNLIQK